MLAELLKNLMTMLLGYLIESPEKLREWVLWLVDAIKAYAVKTDTAIDDLLVEQLRRFVQSADFDRLCRWLREKFLAKSDSVSAADQDSFVGDVCVELRAAGWESIIPVIVPFIQWLFEAWRKRRENVNPKPPVNV